MTIKIALRRSEQKPNIAEAIQAGQKGRAKRHFSEQYRRNLGENLTKKPDIAEVIQEGRYAKTLLISNTPLCLSIMRTYVSGLLKGERMPEWVTQLFNGMIGGGAVAGFVAILDFRLREKWKHDLQQKLEAYKVSLIAEAEAAKAKAELRKSIALRYTEIEFERFVELEHIVAGLPPEVLAYAVMASEHKTNEDHKLLFDKMIELNVAIQRVKMFVSFEDAQKFNHLSQVLAAVIKMHIGDSRPPMPDDAPVCKEVLVASAEVGIVVTKRIKELGQL